MSPLVYSIVAMFAKTSTLMNPITCFFWYRRFREGTRKLWTRDEQLPDGRGSCQPGSTGTLGFTGHAVVFHRAIGSRSKKSVSAQTALDKAKDKKASQQRYSV